MKLRRLMRSAGLMTAAMLLLVSQAYAVVEIQFWHAMGGVLGEHTEKNCQ